MAIDTGAVADDGRVTIEEAQAVIDAGEALFNPAFVAWVSTAADSGGLTMDDAPVRAARQFYSRSMASIVLTRWAVSADELPELEDDATGWHDVVEEVVDVTDECILVIARRDNAALSSQIPAFDAPLFIGMARAENSEVGWLRVLEQFTEPSPPTCGSVDPVAS